MECVNGNALYVVFHRITNKAQSNNKESGVRKIDPSVNIYFRSRIRMMWYIVAFFTNSRQIYAPSRGTLCTLAHSCLRFGAYDPLALHSIIPSSSSSSCTGNFLENYARSAHYVLDWLQRRDAYKNSPWWVSDSTRVKVSLQRINSVRCFKANIFCWNWCMEWENF